MADVKSGWRERIAALLGFSAYQSPKGYGPEIDDPTVIKVREALGGNIQPLPNTRVRWYWADVEDAIHAADTGNISPAAQLFRAMRGDGTLAGLLSQRTSGLVRLPKRFYGDKEIISELEARNGTRSVFDEMFPPAELALLAADGVMLGVGVAELVPVEGRDYPVMVRLEPEYLYYRWVESRWYYRSTAGLLPITPGDGRWILHVPGGRQSPWQFGLWIACGRAFVTKTHAVLHRNNYSAKLANPARVAKTVLGATEAQRTGFLQGLIQWGINTAFELPPGWDVSLLESNGRGIEVFQSEIDTCDKEYMIALAGQLVTTTGGAGFANADIHKTIRADLIKDTGDGLAYTINTQGIPQFVATRWGLDRLAQSAQVDWDTTPAKDLKVEAESLLATAQGIAQMNAALQPYQRTLDIDQVTTRFAVPTIEVEKSDMIVQPPTDEIEQGTPPQILPTAKPKTPIEKAPNGSN